MSSSLSIACRPLLVSQWMLSASHEELHSKAIEAASLPGSSKAALSELGSHSQPIRVYHKTSKGEHFNPGNMACNERTDGLTCLLSSVASQVFSGFSQPQEHTVAAHTQQLQ